MSNETNGKVAIGVIAGAAFLKAFLGRGQSTTTPTPAPSSASPSGVAYGYLVNRPGGLVALSLVAGVGTSVTSGDGQSAPSAYNVLYGSTANTAVQGNDPRVPPASGASNLFWATPAGSTGAFSARRIDGLDVPGIAQNLASVSSPMLNLTNLVAFPKLWLNITGQSGVFWRIYWQQTNYFITYNAQTSDGSTWTKDADTQISSVMAIGNDSQWYWKSNNDTAAHTWSTAPLDVSTQFGMRFRGAEPKWHIQNKAANPLRIFTGGTWPNCAAGQVIICPLDLSYILDVSVVPAPSVQSWAAPVNVTGTPTVTVVQAEGAYLSITATAAGTMQWYGWVSFNTAP